MWIELKSEFGQTDVFTANKWTWVDIQICVTFLRTQVKSQALHDYTKTGVRLLSVSGTDSNEILTLHVLTSYALHSESRSHIGMSTLASGSMLSLSSEQKSSGRGSLKTGLIGVDNKMTLDMLIKHFYTAIQYYKYLPLFVLVGVFKSTGKHFCFSSGCK